MPDADLEISCPYCHRNTEQVRAGRSQGKQRFKCLHCQRRYVEAPDVFAYPTSLHERAVILQQSGKGIRAIARELGVNHQTVANWLQRTPAPLLPDTVELLSVPPQEAVIPAEETTPLQELHDNERKRPTISDVARQAGISTSTVSNYLNNRGYIKTETATRIRQAIEELQFTPNALVRAIRQRHTNILGVLLFGVTELDEEGSGTIAQAVLSGINQAADKAEYNVLLYPGWLYRPHRHPGLPFLDGHIDGLLWVAPNRDEPILEQIARAGLPVVGLLSRHVPAGVGYVNADNLGGVAQLVQYLCQKGHQRIGWIGPAHSSNYLDRLLGYRQGLAVCGLPHDSGIEYELTEDIWERSSYEKALEHCFQQHLPPTAIILPDDGLADIMIQILYARGLRVPEDMAVVGFNDGPDAVERIGGGLTTIRQPFRALGRAAVENLLKIVGGTPAKDACSTLPVELISRRTA